MSSVTEQTNVGMGQIATAEATAGFKTVLGSCIGLILYHPDLKIAVMAHIVLPDSAGRSGTPGKYVDTAVPAMLDMFKKKGLVGTDLKAKVSGGANLFGGTGVMKIGDRNVAAIQQSLDVAGIEVVGVEVGGSKGRRVTFN